jgi:acyl transferase domain-containing protein/NADPH:quinone reductase-like Zn-dependent oxidoreductase/SAM-dependent methyltransferase/acyl carrier protein
MHDASTNGRASRNEIAVIGISGRYPGGAGTPGRLFENLKAGIDAVTEARGDRWDLGYHHPDPERADRIYTKACGLLERIDDFDNEFFGLSPREARQVDPQQRLLLELAWEALEDAAIPLHRIAGSDAGVFVGISSNDYANLVGPGGPDAYSNTGSSFSIAANRISYFLDLHGPSVALDTACSSTIVGVHQAVTSLLAGDCSIALVGGISLLVHVRPWLGFAKASMLSPTGRCKSFDASGDGYVRSEGGGIVVLKPLDAAERDGDRIYGVIVGSGVNSDGHTLGLSMPNGDAQERLLRKIYGASGIAADDVVYVEAHGTGTAVGDPIECGSIGRVLGEPRTNGPLLIGSVKSNIGHLEAASGMAGLTKALLVLHHGEIPPNLHFNDPNPKIDFDAWKLDVVTRTTPLPKRERPAIVGVNSFGFGGTNAHLAIREYRGPERTHANGVTHASGATRTSDAAESMLVLSAHTPAALRAVATAYAAYLRGDAAAAFTFADLCAAAALGRSQLRYRFALSAASHAEAADMLERFVADETPPRSAVGSAGPEAVPVAFVYSGNGPQWWGMGRELLAENASFRREIEAIDAIFAPLAGWSLVEEMARPESDARTSLTEYAQPLLFAQQVALTALLRAEGIAPAAVLGHSVGEVAAAHASGALSLEAAVTVIYQRSLHQASTAGTGMMAAVGIGASEAEAEIARIPGWLEVAASNGPKAATVAGDPEALETLRASLTDAGKFARVLALQYPFHTSAMDPIKDGLLASLAALAPGESNVPFFSTVDVEELPGTELGAAYWWRNVREPVRFFEAVDRLIVEREIGVFLEIGPHPVLRDYVAQCAKAREKTVAAIGTLRRPSANRAESDVENLATAICACYANGGGALEARFTRPNPMPALPLYPWQKTPHWRGTTVLPDVHQPTERDHPLLGYRHSSSDGLWENTIDTNLLPYLQDHVVQGSVVFPAAGYIECALAAARTTLGAGTLDVESLEVMRPLAIPSHTDPLLQTSADAKDGTFAIASRADKHFGTWTPHVRGRVSRADARAPQERIDLAALRARLPVHVSSAEHYAAAAKRGLAYGPAFQGVRDVFMSEPDADVHEALAEIDLPELDTARPHVYEAHPSVTDSVFQIILTLIGAHEPRPCSILPVFVERIRVFAPLPNRVACSARITRESERSAVADFVIYDESGATLATLTGTRCLKVDFARGSATSLIAEWWRPDPAFAPETVAPLVALETHALAGIVAADAQAEAAAFERETYYAVVRPQIERLAGSYAARALAELGAAEAPFDLARLARRGRVKSERRELLAALVAMAEADGTLVAGDGGWTWNDARPAAAPDALWREIFNAHPRYVAELQLCVRAGETLVATLRSGLPEDGDGIPDLARVLDGTPFATVYERLARRAIDALVETWPLDRPIRILELGAGGGVTGALLPGLPAERTDYVGAVGGETALGRAALRFATFPFARFASLDLDDENALAGHAPGSFDIVVASNALSAARDLGNALALVERLLCPGGYLIALEARATRFTTLAFDGAAHLRDGDAWAFAFEEAGFTEIAALDDVAGTDRGPDQTIYLTRKPAAAPALPAAVEHSDRRRLVLCGPAEAQSALLAAFCERLRAAGDAVDVHVVSADAGLTEDAASALVAELDADSVVVFAGTGPDPQTETGCLSALHLVRAVEATRHERAPQLTFVTRGALASPFAGPPTPGHAPLFGLARVVANEYPGLGVRAIDVHAKLDNAAAGTLLAREVLGRDDETEVLLHNGLRYVNRERIASLADLAETEPAAEYRLDFLPSGGLDSLHLRHAARREPGPNDVEIRVRAAGLNFRDVLWAMGMLPEEAVEEGFSGPTIGMECAGEIVRVGAAVCDLRPGDRVIAFASSCFASHVTTDAGSVAPMPAGLAFDEAATIPIAFLTAYYALDELARIKPNETVLVHGAAGGVGLAAVQIAKLRGARVIGTAGTPAKRRLVELAGADHVLDSRSLEFADDVMALTNGAGVDVVLNSLAGEAIAKGLAILRPFGRFLEIGKRDLYANSRIGLRPFRKNLSYFGIDADTLLIERADLARTIFREVGALFASGKLHPLPFQSVPVTRAAEAFRTMQQSKHVGKIVLALPESDADVRCAPGGGLALRAEGTYLVTGGLGGFGLTTARWLVHNGARSIALVGRRGAVTDEARAGIAAMEEAGAVVRAFAADVSDAAAVARTVATIRAEMAPLRGVIHSAAVIEDAPVLGITDDLFARVYEPKARGAWHLHEATLDDDLDLFVLYSSVSVMVGNPGQGAYVAANTYLEALAQYRRALGRPALAVGWGAIADTGFLTRNTAVADMLKHRSGLDATPAADALAELGGLLAARATRVCVARYNLQRLGQMLAGARVPRFVPLIPAGMTAETDTSDSLAEALKLAPENERRALIVARICRHAGRVLGTGNAQIDVDRPLAEMGLDSLMAVELAEAVERDVAQPISVMQMLGAGTVGAIADLVLKTLGLGGDAGDAAPAAPAEPATPKELAAAP